jgi:hypothetical protein
MTGRACRQVGRDGGRIGPFEGTTKNADAMLRVIRSTVRQSRTSTRASCPTR